jgi:signal peptidase I
VVKSSRIQGTGGLFSLSIDGDNLHAHQLVFFTKSSEVKQARLQAENLLRLGEKVDAYRCDILPQAQLDCLRRALERLRELYQDKSTPAAALEEASQLLHTALEPCGGDIYPVTFWCENIEMLLVAAILAIGVRSFFLQPFVIPSNSMWPTYYGMTPGMYQTSDTGPSLPAKVWNFLVRGAKHYDVIAPTEGEVTFPVTVKTDQENHAAYVVFTTEPHAGRKWLFVPQKQSEYTINVGGAPVKVDVPEDFHLDEVILRTYFPDMWGKVMYAPEKLFALLETGRHLQQDAFGRYFVTTGQHVKQGEKVLNFDLLSGDMLFVDRLSYNFTEPKVGDPFVFSTHGIMGLNGGQGDQYFIKRLVGKPGDQLQIQEPVLFRDGSPIQLEKPRVLPFTYNAKRENNYPGYVYRGSLSPRATEQVLPGQYFAMGDNSPVSYDSRFWGGVPAQNVVGRPLLIVYPFTSRWGLAQ